MSVSVSVGASVSGSNSALQDMGCGGWHLAVVVLKRSGRRYAGRRWKRGREGEVGFSWSRGMLGQGMDGTVRYGTVRYGTVRYGTVRYGGVGSEAYVQVAPDFTIQRASTEMSRNTIPGQSETWSVNAALIVVSCLPGLRDTDRWVNTSIPAARVCDARSRPPHLSADSSGVPCVGWRRPVFGLLGAALAAVAGFVGRGRGRGDL